MNAITEGWATVCVDHPIPVRCGIVLSAWYRYAFSTSTTWPIALLTSSESIGIITRSDCSVTVTSVVRAIPQVNGIGQNYPSHQIHTP